MNRQPYQTPPRWWSPRISSKWMPVWPRRRAPREHGLTQVELHGVEHLRQALADGHGVLITPNQPTRQSLCFAGSLGPLGCAVLLHDGLAGFRYDARPGAPR